MKEQIRYSKKIADFICEKVESGMNVTQLCDKYPDKVPSRMTIYRWRRDKEEFANKLKQAYTCYVNTKMDELDAISTKSLDELYPQLDFKAAAEARRARIDTLKFQIMKVAPMLTDAFDKSTKIEHSGEVSGPTIVIQSYALPEEKQVNNLLEDKDHE